MVIFESLEKAIFKLSKFILVAKEDRSSVASIPRVIFPAVGTKRGPVGAVSGSVRIAAIGRSVHRPAPT